MEWRVFFQNPRSAHHVAERRTAVVQVADTRGLILVIQVYHMSRFPKSLIALLENSDIPKLGVNILNDGRKLFRDYGILAQNLVELGAIAAKAESGGASAKKHGRTMVSLAKLVEKYCGKTLEKGKERTGNWEAELSASSSMVEYAANDVHSTMMILARLEELAAANSNIPAEHLLLFSQASPGPMSTGRLPTSFCRRGAQQRDAATVYSCVSVLARPRDELDKMCIDLRVNKTGGADAPGLKRGTIISYIISALQADEKLPFEMPRLLELVQMDLGSWSRHRQWLLRKWTRA
ncbi:ribonuclease H-like domain-containing protein [Infundibulicybe gibba]|nr:ribonuclease H-like domain-containing protein [Infundibulicybe gibba]